MYLMFHIDINECLGAPCQNSGTCVDLEDGYWCICTHQFGGLTCRRDKNYYLNNK